MEGRVRGRIIMSPGGREHCSGFSGQALNDIPQLVFADLFPGPMAYMMDV